MALLTKHVQHLNRCLAIYPIMWDALAACLPTEITDHSHYQKLISSLKNQRFHQLKIRVESEISSGVCIIASRSSSTGVRRNFSELRDKVTQYGEDGIRCKEECIEGTVKMKRRKRIQKSGKINATRNIIHRKVDQLYKSINVRHNFEL